MRITSLFGRVLETTLVHLAAGASARVVEKMINPVVDKTRDIVDSIREKYQGHQVIETAKEVTTDTSTTATADDPRPKKDLK